MRHETERLFFRLWTPDDAEAGFAMYSDPEVLRWIGNPPPTESIEAQREKFEADQERYLSLQQQGLGVWAVIEKETELPIGTALYKHFRNSTGRESEPELTEIGWHIVRSRWGMGYGTEFARKLQEISHNREGIARACAFVENRPSTRIMEKIGMTFMGVTTDYYDESLVYYESKAVDSNRE